MNRSINQLALGLAFITLGSGLLGAVASISNTVSGAGWRPSWFMFGFELVVIAAGVIGVMLARGRFGSPALGLVCVAGTVMVASLFGYLGSGGSVWGVGIKPLLTGRGVLGLALFGIAAATQLHGRPRDVRRLVRGVALGAGALAIPLLAYVLRNAAANWSEIVVLSLLMVSFVLVVGLIAASADCLIRAFSPGDESART